MEKMMHGNQRVDPLEVVQLYKDGWSMRQVGEQVGLSLERIRQILEARNIPRRPKHITRHSSKYQGRRATSELKNEKGSVAE